MNSYTVHRELHAVVDMLPHKKMQVMKIASLFDLASRQQPMRLLEIGIGPGVVAHWFATQPDLRCEVAAIDARDHWEVRSSYIPRPVRGGDLSFDDMGVEVVIANHVIKHVDEARVQLRRLIEIRQAMTLNHAGYSASKSCT